jgi:fatty-acyl-CoA synthase
MSIYDDGLGAGSANRVSLSPVSFLERSALAFPGKLAVVDEGREIDYASLLARCLAFADALRRREIGRGDTVSVIAANSLGMLEAHYGVPMAGAVLNTINVRLDPGTVAYILEHSEAKLVMASRECLDLARAALAKLDRPIPAVALDGNSPGAGWQDYEAFLAEGRAEGAVQLPADEWDAISLCYTSGTTGRPKGVVYHHRGAYLNALGNALGLGLGPQSVYLWTLPMFHCNGWTFTWAVTAAGGTHVCHRAVAPARIFQAIGEHGVTHLCGAPTVLTMIAHARPEERRPLPHPVLAATGGAAPTSAIIEAMEALGFRVQHLYGLTETYGPCLISEAQPDWPSLVLQDRARLMARQGVRTATCGGAVVLDRDSGAPVRADGATLGEIAVRGNTVMKGYLKDRAATEAVFKEGWFRTGDLGVQHPDNAIEVKDRAKDIIISGGENVSSLEVEEALSRHPAVLECAVVAKPDPHWGETVCAFVAVKPGMAEPSAADLTEWCRAHLAGFKRPRTFVLGELPKTATGKVQKTVLRERAKGTQSDDGAGR